jgi:hypothetical protein
VAERGWRTPGEVWRAYEAKMCIAEGVQRDRLIVAGGCGGILSFGPEGGTFCAEQRPCRYHGGPGGRDLV